MPASSSTIHLPVGEQYRSSLTVDQSCASSLCSCLSLKHALSTRSVLGIVRLGLRKREQNVAAADWNCVEAGTRGGLENNRK